MSNADVWVDMSVALTLIAIGLLLFLARPWSIRLPEGRAQELLRTLLTADEYACLLTTGYLEVASSTLQSGTYRIPRHGGRVKVYEHGQLVCTLCVQRLVRSHRATLCLRTNMAGRQ